MVSVSERSCELFGAKITPLAPHELLDTMFWHVENLRQCVFAHLNLHGMRVWLDSDEFRELHRMPNTYVYVDGMPVLLLARLLGHRLRREQRVTALDVIFPVLTKAESAGWKIFFVGGRKDVTARGLRALRAKFPRLCISGASGFFNDSPEAPDNIALLQHIRSFRPHLIIVGMGMGRQEGWILRNRRRLWPVPIWAVGALMEYISGEVPVPPRWMGRCGLEWSYRLLSHPQRFWKRYVLEPITLVPFVLGKGGSK